MVADRQQPVRRLPRARRREQVLAAATEAFARSGFAATSLEDIAAEAGVTRVILYRHFDSKTDLYQAVLDRMCARLDARVAEPVGGFTDASIDGLLDAAAESPAGFRLLFQHALREPEFSERIEKFRADITAAASSRSQRWFRMRRWRGGRPSWRRWWPSRQSSPGWMLGSPTPPGPRPGSGRRSWASSAPPPPPMRSAPFPPSRPRKDQHHDEHRQGKDLRDSNSAAEAGLGQGRARLRQADRLLREDPVRRRPGMARRARPRPGPGGRRRHRPQPSALPGRRHPHRDRAQPRDAGHRPAARHRPWP